MWLFKNYISCNYDLSVLVFGFKKISCLNNDLVSRNNDLCKS